MINSQGLKSGVILRNGKYRIEKVLGKGSFGITYLATAKFTTQGNLGQMDVEAKVAIKEFFMSEVNVRKDDGSTIEGSSGSVFSNYRKKFRKEAENLSKLSHPNIVKVFDVFDENNTTYYVMEFLDGQNLDDYIKQKGHLNENESISVFKEVGRALAHMHSKKMLHLDIKPKNIMRKNDGKYYLIDFGLSKQFTDEGEPESSTSVGLGTPGYAPIEQSEYKQDGTFPATLDVYALSATLFKMLTGERPPEATYILNEGFPVETLRHISISENTINALKKGMSSTKKQRYQDVISFLNDIEEATSVEPILEPMPQPKPVSSPKPKSRKWLWYAIGLIMVVMLSFLIWPSKTADVSSTTLLTDSNAIKTIKQAVPDTVIDMKWNSPLGKAVYTGAVQPDSVVGSNKLIPHGKGYAKITSGNFAGSVYDGTFSWGNYEGQTKYVQSNGDVFEGTFKNNEYNSGKYTIKSSGEYFKGTFKNGQPAKGQWYDRNGHKI